MLRLVLLLGFLGCGVQDGADLHGQWVETQDDALSFMAKEDFKNAEGAYQEAVRLGTELRAEELTLAAEVGVLHALVGQSRIDEAETKALGLLAEAKNYPESPSAMEINLILGRIYHSKGDSEQRKRFHQAAVAAAEPLGLDLAISRVSANAELVEVLLDQGSFEEALTPMGSLLLNLETVSDLPQDFKAQLQLLAATVHVYNAESVKATIVVDQALSNIKLSGNQRPVLVRQAQYLQGGVLLLESKSTEAVKVLSLLANETDLNGMKFVDQAFLFLWLAEAQSGAGASEEEIKASLIRSREALNLTPGDAAWFEVNLRAEMAKVFEAAEMPEAIFPRKEIPVEVKPEAPPPAKVLTEGDVVPEGFEGVLVKSDSVGVDLPKEEVPDKIYKEGDVLPEGFEGVQLSREVEKVVVPAASARPRRVLKPGDIIPEGFEGIPLDKEEDVELPEVEPEIVPAVLYKEGDEVPANVEVIKLPAE